MPRTPSARSSARFAAGLILIELLGLTGALAVGAGCSAIAGLVALAIDRRSPDAGVAGAAEPSAAEPVAGRPQPVAEPSPRAPQTDPPRPDPRSP